MKSSDLIQAAFMPSFLGGALRQAGKRWMAEVARPSTVALILAAGACGPAQATWTALINGDALFGVAATYANLRKVDFSVGTSTATTFNTLTTEQTASRLTLTSPASASFSQTNTTSKTGMSGNKMYWNSTTSLGYKTTTIAFANGGTSYVAFMWHLGLKDSNGAYVTYNLSDGTSQTLTSCSATTSGCIGAYVPSSFLSDLLSLLTLCLFGCNQYDSVYMTYVPAGSAKITSIVFGNGRCDGCGFLGANTSQDMFVDNLSYVDPTVAPHHLEVTATSATISSGSTTTFTIKACANAACSELYTTGMTGTFSLTGTGLTPTYPTGQTYTIGARSSSTTITASITPAGTATVALTAPSIAPTNTPSVFCGMGVAAASGNSCDLTVTQPLHHVRIQASDGLTCSPLTYTLTACSNADCSQKFTGGVTGNLSVTGAGMTVNYPDGAAFSISADATATDTVSVHATTVGSLTTATLSALSETPTGSPSVYCGMNGAAPSSGGSCTVSVASSRLTVSIPDHYSDAAATATITAVRASDDNASCTPAFASVSKNVTLKCTYSNPATGTKAVRVGGAALNAGNNAASACDGTGQSVSLSFNASGVATPVLQYADVGAMGLSATYTGAGSDAGLSMTGSDSFIVAPYYFDVAGPGAGDIKAGNTFSATVTARNLSGAATPNFGKETSAEGVTLAFVRTQPSGTSAVNGSFSGSVGAFNAGAATGSNLSWTEVGRGDVSATLTDAGNDGYLSSGLKSGGSTAGWAACAAEGGTCTLPTGATGYVAYGANGFYAIATGVTGSIACTNGVFGDPISGIVKSCLSLVTSGASPGAAGGIVPSFTPHHFDVATSNGCGTFTYGGFTTAGVATLPGQPFSVTVRARNAAGDTTANYDGSVNTSPNYAKATTLSVVGGTNIHSMTNATVAASSFASGVATVSTPTLLFADSKLRAATAVTIRATDTDSITSNGATEGTIALRSGRIRVSNAFGSEKSTLQVPVQAQYWSGSAWVLNAADSCTSILANSVALSNHLDHKGAASATWTTTPSAVTITGGHGVLTLSASTPVGSVGSVDFALNLGTAGTDGSCQITPRPASTAGNLPWLRAQNGSGNNCSDATYTRDPSARATFGVYKPESKKAVFAREVY